MNIAANLKFTMAASLLLALAFASPAGAQNASASSSEVNSPAEQRFSGGRSFGSDIFAVNREGASAPEASRALRHASNSATQRQGTALAVPNRAASTGASAPEVRSAQEANALNSGVYAIKNAKIFTLSGAPIDNGTLVIRGGKIAAIGANVEIPNGAKIIDATGLQVYPGMFDAATQIGLEEVSAVKATVDTVETTPFNPDVTAATAFNADSAHVDVMRADGITEILTVPGTLGGGFGGGGGSVIGGNASAVNLGGWNINDMVINRDAAMELTWPSISTGSFDFTTFTFKRLPFEEAKKQYQQKVDALSDLFDKARHYAQAMQSGSNDFPRDLKLEALARVVQGKEPLFVIANSARDIRNAVEFCGQQKVRMILGGADEAWKTIDLLKKDNIPVIIGPILSMQQGEDDPYDADYAMPSELYAAGVKIAFGSFNTQFARRLSQYAGTAVGYGLPHDEALKAVTVNAAQMLGLDNIGTLEPGKVANIVVTDGDLLELRTHVKYLFIKGQLTSLDNKQLELYNRFRNRPKLQSQP